LEIGRRLVIVSLVVAIMALSVAGWNRVGARQDEIQPVASLNATSLSQLTPGAEPSLTVTGYGEATAPADSVQIELLIGLAEDFGMNPRAREVPVLVRPDTGNGATPAAGNDGDAEEYALDPLFAVLDEAGIPSEEIDVAISPLAPDPYQGPYSALARLAFTVDDPELAAINALMASASEAAGEAGLAVIQAGAAYQLDDCQALEDEAQQAAIDDARQKAERLADQLGVTTGEIVLASDFGFFGGPDGGGGCAPYDGAGNFSSYGGPGGLFLSVADFDPSKPAEVRVAKQLYLGLAIM
jgi:uncharacterized protein YggE